MHVNEIDLEKRQMLLRDFQSGLTRLQAKENIVLKFGDCVGYGERTCDRWFTKFKSGDFDLTTKPRDKVSKKNRDYRKKKSRRSTRTIKKVNEVKFNQQGATMDVEKNNATVQKILKSKPQLTISKVSKSNGTARVKKPQAESNIIMKRLGVTPIRPVLFSQLASNEVSPLETNGVPLEMPKLRPRRPRSKGIEVQLPVSAAKRMNPQTLTENHSIGEGNKLPIRTETAKNTISEQLPRSREVTVQFQNISPEVTKNTVRKNKLSYVKEPFHFKPQQSKLKIVNVAHIESISPEKSKTTDQTSVEIPSLQPVSPLNNQKGIIYLNPQEIFRRSFGSFENSLTKPYSKSVQQIHTLVQPPSRLPPPSAEKHDSVVICDSDDEVVDGEGDVLFPKNIRLPAPKIKAGDTYTSYFDLESGMPIHVNAAKPVSTKPGISGVIEID